MVKSKAAARRRQAEAVEAALAEADYPKDGPKDPLAPFNPYAGLPGGVDPYA